MIITILMTIVIAALLYSVIRFIVAIIKNKVNIGIVLACMIGLLVLGGISYGIYGAGKDIWTVDTNTLLAQKAAAQTPEEIDAFNSNLESLKSNNNIFWLFKVNDDLDAIEVIVK